MNPTPSCVRNISLGRRRVIGRTDGTETLANADDVFSWIDPDFRKLGGDAQSLATVETPVEVFEMNADGTFPTVFGSFNHQLDELSFTQPQIKGFCRNHRDQLLIDGYGTFFLFKFAGEFHVAVVLIFLGKLHIHTHPFFFPRVWHVDRHQRRVVIP